MWNYAGRKYEKNMLDKMMVKDAVDEKNHTLNPQLIGLIRKIGVC